jgi:acyl-coenzyme A synthetase/AMP-(fatty) acid ligase
VGHKSERHGPEKLIDPGFSAWRLPCIDDTEVRFVEEFPATLSGKIQKYKMREFEIAARGLEDEAKTAMA